MPQQKEKPMMVQYRKIKEQYLDAILLFRVGGFFQMYFNDAKIAHEVLGLKLISRNAGYNVMIPMCGVPSSSAEAKAQALSEKGYRSVICDQVSGSFDPATGLTARKVTKVFDPKGEKIDLTDAWKKYLDENTFEPAPPKPAPPKPASDVKSTDIISALIQTDLDKISPVEALNLLYDWKRKFIPEEIKT